MFFKRIEKIVCFRAKKKALMIIKASSGLLRCDYLNGAGLKVGAVANVVVLLVLDGDSLGNLILSALVSYSTLPALVNVWALLGELRTVLVVERSGLLSYLNLSYSLLGAGLLRRRAA